jgi:hypothetical protein
VGDEILRGALPSNVELLCGRVQEGEAGAVGRLLDAVEQRCIERPAERIGGQIVDAAVAHDRRRTDRSEDPQDRRPDALGRRTPALWRDGAGGSGEVEEVRALGVVESCSAPASASSTPSDTPLAFAALQALVVLDADPGQRGNLITAQPPDAARTVGRQPYLLGRHPSCGGSRGTRQSRWWRSQDQHTPIRAAYRCPVSTPHAVGLRDVELDGDALAFRLDDVPIRYCGRTHLRERPPPDAPATSTISSTFPPRRPERRAVVRVAELHRRSSLLLWASIQSLSPIRSRQLIHLLVTRVSARAAATAR